MFKYLKILLAFVSLSAFGQNYNTGITYDRTTSKAAPITVYYPTLQNYVKHFVAGTTPSISWNTNEYGFNVTADTTFSFANIPTDSNLVRRIHFLVIGDGTHFLTNTANTIYWQTPIGLTQNGTNEYWFEWNGGVINGWMRVNALKWIDSDKWVFPQLADEAGAIITTNNAASELNGHATFSGSGATNANWVVYEWVVPDDIDTAVDLKVARFKFTTAGTSTSSATFNIGMQDMADSADQETISLANFSNWVAMTTGTLTSPAAKDGFTLSAITLTSWKSSLTAGHTVHIMVCRDGAGDANNDAMTDKFLVVSYGRTQ